jgi:hypothetical protein
MRTVRVIKEAALVLLSSAGGALLLFVSSRELTRPQGLQYATLKGMVPISASKAPWWLLIAVLLLALWFSARTMGGRRGTLWGLWRGLLRLGLWWSVVGLLLFAGVAIVGVRTQPLSDLNWSFALGSTAALLLILIACAVGRARTMNTPP